MLIGVVLAFGWNMAASSQQGSGAGSGVTPQVGLTVNQAAAQAWAAGSPGGSPHAAGDLSWMSSVPYAPGRPTPR